MLQLLARSLRKQLFPIHIAANKSDLAIKGVLDLVSANGLIVPCFADMELGLRRASAAGIIDYQIGSNKFDIVDDSKLNPQQIDALQRMGQKLSVEGSTGVAEIIDRVLFDQLKHIVVYPVQDEGNGLTARGRFYQMRLLCHMV